MATSSKKTTSAKTGEGSTKKSSTTKTAATKKATTQKNVAAKKPAEKKTTEHKAATTQHKEPESQFDPKYIFLVLGILAVVIIGAILLATSDSTTPQDGVGQQALPEVDETIESGAVLATVNGVEITEGEIEQMLGAQGGMQVPREEALEQAIMLEVLSQEVEAQGYSVSREEAESEFEQMLIQQGLDVETFKQQIESQGMSYDEQVSQFKEQLQIERYLEEALSLDLPEVSEEEARDFYDNYAMQTGEELPPFEEVRGEIETSIQQQQVDELRNQHIQELMGEASIEYHQ